MESQAPRKICPACKIAKPPDDFYRSARSKDGRGHRCKACISAYEKTHRHNTRRATNVYHRRIAAIIREAKAGKPCAKCGVEGLPTPALHFHHVRGRKRFTISQWAKKFPLKPGESKTDAVRAEIAKCEILCPTCHYLEHTVK